MKTMKDTRQEEIDKINNRLMTLNMIYELLKSHKSDEEKLTVLWQTFSTYTKFISTYESMVKDGVDENLVIASRKALNHFKEIDNEVKRLFSNKQLFHNIRYQNAIINELEKNDYLTNYQYAEWIITEYINSEEVLDDDEFIEKYEIDFKTYDNCVNIINYLNPVLAKKYNEKLNENKKKRLRQMIDEIISIYIALDDGNFQDLTKLDLVEFYKRLPMRNKCNPFIEVFVGENLGYGSDIYKKINLYLKENEEYMNAYTSEEIELEKNTTNPETIHMIFEYMKYYRIPQVEETYNIILNRYLNNEIDLNIKPKKKLTLKNNPFTYKKEI